jgi:ferredoxin
MLPAGVVWAAGAILGTALLLLPRWAAPAPQLQPAKSVVDESICTGCEQCYLDCPYEAIAMIPRPGATQAGRSALVAHVQPELCVSCGICSGSCAPMGVGPPGRTGRDQLAAIRRFLAAGRPGSRDVIVIACDRGAGQSLGASREAGVHVYPINCAGNLHTSVIEFCLRSGSGGVLVLACPPRDCWNREGPKWTEQRLFHDREEELQERVDRRRVRLAYASAAEPGVVRAAIAQFRADIAALAAADGESDIDVVRECMVEEQQS